MALKKSKILSRALTNKLDPLSTPTIDGNKMLMNGLTLIISFIFLLYSYKYLNQLDTCNCGNKKNVQNMEWVDQVFMLINLINLTIFVILFFTGINITSIFSKISNYLPILISIVGLYGLFAFYCEFLFIVNFFNYYYTLPDNCECYRDDIKRYILYTQGGIYSLSIFFIILVIIKVIFNAMKVKK